jgi:hypothetical protein
MQSNVAPAPVLPSANPFAPLNAAIGTTPVRCEITKPQHAVRSLVPLR